MYQLFGPPLADWRGIDELSDVALDASAADGDEQPHERELHGAEPD